MNTKPRIALLLGGTSPEREVSKSTGKSVYKALQNLGYPTVIIDPAYGDDQRDNIDLFFANDNYGPISNPNYIKAMNLDIWKQIDLAFLALHGKWGEDGTIQSLLELKEIKYTGSKVLSSALAMDKIKSKILFDHHKVTTPKWFAVKNGDSKTDYVIDRIKTELNFPAVIKPNDQGSSVGLTICKSENEVEAAINLTYEYSDRVLIEEYIPGRELTVAVLDDKPLPVLEIKPKHGLYDYECKYTSGMSEYIVPAEIPGEVSHQLQVLAFNAFKALRCETYARVDFRLSPDHKPYTLEVNTLPGMTSLSLVPKMAKAVGISFDELVEKIINLSL
ncbi:MAG: D-alanine--D-alanine ligase [Ignavibacteriaceae bacterium]|nr:D-alanine--D-alanine ligase [Ignavibacteriaceae bacterium]